MSTPPASEPPACETDTEIDIGVLLRRFPLVARRRLPCVPPDERFIEITGLLQAATTAADPTGLRAVALNKAVLLASDQRDPALARELCWSHHRRYPTASPNERDARLALEPLINLARLALRDGDPDRAITILDNLLRSATSATPVVVDGGPVHLDHTRLADDERRPVRTWLWMMLLAEGLRGLATAGRWREAFQHAENHHAIAARPFDGRQVAIAALIAEGDPDRARVLIASTDTVDPWEHAVVAALAAATTPSESQARQTMVDRYLSLRLDQLPQRAARLGAVSGARHLGRRDDDRRTVMAMARMRPEVHCEQAELLLARAEKARENHANPAEGHESDSMYWVAVAHVHATLATLSDTAEMSFQDAQ